MSISRVAQFVIIFMISSSQQVLAEPLLDVHKSGYVVVTPNGPDDGGDFGPKTEGTKTAGIQEALDYASSLNTKQHSQINLYIAKGNYWTYETIHIPWMGEAFRIHAKDSSISYRKEFGDVLVIDSQMNSRFEFGYVAGVKLKKGWIVRVAPTDPGPSAPLPKERQSAVMVSTLLKFNAIVARAYFMEGQMQERGNGILLDATQGAIANNKIDISELNTCNLGVEMRGSCTFNDVDVWFIHGCNTHLKIGANANHNRLKAFLIALAYSSLVNRTLFSSQSHKSHLIAQ